MRGPRLQKLATATVRSVAAGVIGVAFIQAILLGMGFMFAGIPAAGVLALLVMFLGILQVPALIVTLPAIAWLWVSGDGSTTSNIVWTIYLGVAGMADNVLKPLLLGRGVDAPMPVILIGALGGMVTGGIIGLFVGGVLLAVGYQLFMEWVDDVRDRTAVVDSGFRRCEHGSKESVAAWAVLVAALALNACVTVGPDFQEPDVAWLNEWQSDLYGQVGQPEQQAQTDLRFWTQLFNDPVLNGLIETARRENPSLRIAGLRILESRALLGIAGSGRYPQLQQATGDAAYVNEQQSGGAAPRDQSFTSYQAGFELGWELDFWGRFRRSIESANAAYLASVTGQQDVQVLLSAQVADFYYAYRTTQLRIDITRHNVALQKRSLEITQKIFEAGEDSELDVQQAKTQYLSTLAVIPELEATLIRLRNALAALLGRTPGDVPELESTKVNCPPIEPLVIEGIPAQLLLRRPDIRYGGLADRGAIGADRRRKGRLLPGHQPARQHRLERRARSTAVPTRPRLVAGPALTWNLFDYGRIRNNVRLQDARLQQSIESVPGRRAAGGTGNRRCRHRRRKDGRAEPDTQGCAQGCGAFTRSCKHALPGGPRGLSTRAGRAAGAVRPGRAGTAQSGRPPQRRHRVLQVDWRRLERHDRWNRWSRNPRVRRCGTEPTGAISWKSRPADR